MSEARVEERNGWYYVLVIEETEYGPFRYLHDAQDCADDMNSGPEDRKK